MLTNDGLTKHLNQNRMKQQLVVVLSGSDYASDMEKEVNKCLEKGWLVVSVTAQHVATGSSQTARGGYFIVFERILD
jgi:hypothetical protein